MDSDTARPQSYLRHIVFLLRILVLALVILFFYCANSFCITIVLACFVSILIDPIISYLERRGVSRPLSAALLIVAGMLSFGWLAYSSYNRMSSFMEYLPAYTERISEFIKPVSEKISKVEESAGQLSANGPSKKVTEVKVRQAPVWPTYLIRGFGSLTSVGLTLGVIPFLMFFMLTRKGKWSHAIANWLGPGMEASEFSNRFALIVRRFLIGNLLMGGFLALATCTLLFILKIDGALMLGIISGALNLIPFLGVILAILIPMLAALLQSGSIGTMVIIGGTVIALHILAAYLLIPRFIGSRINIGPVAATAGILFWGWIWGIVGILLALPLTGIVKLIADCQPSLGWLSELLGNETSAAPVDVPRKQNVAPSVTSVRLSG